MLFVNSVQPYTPPDSSKVHLLSGITLSDTLTFDKIMSITHSPYSNENWIQLAYFVSKNSLRPYHNEDLGRIADQKISKRKWLIDETSVNCLFYETNLHVPTICDWTRHFLLFTPNDFLGSLGIFALHLSTDVNEHMALRQITSVAQYQLASSSPFQRFIVAIQKENRWELAFGETLPTKIPKKYIESKKVKISIFNDPSQFFHELLREGQAINIPHNQYEVSVRI